MTPQEKETKLQEVAELTYKDFRYELKPYVEEAFIEGAKSEAAREYHQQEPKEVDLYSLRGDFVQYAWNNGRGLTADKIFDWFIPHLQPKKESDATVLVEALEKIIDQSPYSDDMDSRVAKKALAEFKQSKTNSDGNTI